ncbi:MAG: carbamoyltransferase HypF [Oligoflexia bacterium]|nr:carbamoyltransferase HypF [Oligoflexia bacterium]
MKSFITFNNGESDVRSEKNSFHSKKTKTAEISADLKICDDCLNDIFDVNNRRYQYPFTNCTNCGPRFSIIIDRPYDRELTSMSHFQMCNDCLNEYNNPLDRRFHAQPNACPACGPQLNLLFSKNYFNNFNNSNNSNKKDDSLFTSKIITTIDALQEGMIVAIKGIGGFNFAADPFNETTVKRLRDIKKRQHRSFALMIKSVEVGEKYCHINKYERQQLESTAAPIVLLKKKNHTYDNLSPDNNYLGLMLPYTPLHHLIFKLANFDMLIMTSANRYNEPIAIDDLSIIDLLDSGLADLALTHNREIVHRSDDSIIQVDDNGVIVTIRRSRGFVPTAFKISNSQLPKFKSDNLLSLGAQMKNTFSYRKGNKVYISQHIGDLEDARNMWYQEQEIKELKKLLDVDIDMNSMTNTDAHNGFSNFNDNENSNQNHIYHHHAHLLSVIGEHHLNLQDEKEIKSIIGIIADGTGLGTDGNIWGFEFLKIDSADSIDYFKRLAHLKYFPLPGGESAIHEVDRIAISLLKSSGIKHSKWPTKYINNERAQLITKIIDSNINSVLVSSLGRLFDGVAAILYPINKIEYEAQAAILLQKDAELFLPHNAYNRNIKQYPTTSSIAALTIIDFTPLINGIVNDIREGVSTSEIAYKFHAWIIDSIMNVLQTIDPQNSCIKAISGGCFQNLLLLNMLQKAFENKNIKYYRNQKVPINDAGISFGQALI